MFFSVLPWNLFQFIGTGLGGIRVEGLSTRTDYLLLHVAAQPLPSQDTTTSSTHWVSSLLKPSQTEDRTEPLWQTICTFPHIFPPRPSIVIRLWCIERGSWGNRITQVGKWGRVLIPVLALDLWLLLWCWVSSVLELNKLLFDPACPSSGHAHSFLQEGFLAQHLGSSCGPPASGVSFAFHWIRDKGIFRWGNRLSTQHAQNGTQQSKQDLAYLIFESLLVSGALKMFRTICSANEQHLLTQ